MRADVVGTRTPLSARAYEELLRAILDGGLRPGQRLVVTDLAATLGMSRTPVRDALKRLAVAHVVERDGSRFQVVEPKPRDLRDLLELLVLLEPRAACEAAKRRADDRPIAVTRLVEADAAPSGPHEFHVTLGGLGANPYVAEAIRVLNERLITARRLIDGPCRDGGGHGAILAAIRAGDPQAARAACAEHLVAVRRELHRVRVP